MHLVVDLQPGLLGVRGFAYVCKTFVEAAAAINVLYLSKGVFPPLYSTKVRWRNEPLAGQGIEEIATLPTVLRRGWGDCDDLVAWRIAELRLRGIEAEAKVIYRPKKRLYHVLVRLPNGESEDPSRLLGM